MTGHPFDDMVEAKDRGETVAVPRSADSKVRFASGSLALAKEAVDLFQPSVAVPCLCSPTTTTSRSPRVDLVGLKNVRQLGCTR